MASVSGETPTQDGPTDRPASSSVTAGAAEAAAADAACMQDGSSGAAPEEGAAGTSAEAGPAAEEQPAGASPAPPGTAQAVPGTGLSTTVDRPLSSLPPPASTVEAEECHVAYFEEGVRVSGDHNTAGAYQAGQLMKAQQECWFRQQQATSSCTARGA